MISDLAVVHSGARIGHNTGIAPFALIEDNVMVGDDCEIGPQVVLRSGAEIGPGCRLAVGVVIGEPPLDTAYQGEPTRVLLGARNDVREYVTIHRSTGPGTSTLVGSDNLLMPYVHIAHNCRIGNHVIVTNACQLAGHVEVEDHAVLGGMIGIHQFTRIGAYAMAGACSYLARDLPPFMLGAGNPFRVRGINSVGLRRAGFSAAAIQALRRLYRIVYRSGLHLSDALAELRASLPQLVVRDSSDEQQTTSNDAPSEGAATRRATPHDELRPAAAEVRRFIHFAEQSRRGLQLNAVADEKN